MISYPKLGFYFLFHIEHTYTKQSKQIAIILSNKKQKSSKKNIINECVDIVLLSLLHFKLKIYARNFLGMEHRTQKIV